MSYFIESILQFILFKLVTMEVSWKHCVNIITYKFLKPQLIVIYNENILNLTL